MKQNNIGQSIKARLWNVASAQKRSLKDNQIYHLMLVRYIQERLLYRLSKSEVRGNFFLKGGALLYSYDKFEARPTLDIDFLGKNISREIDNIKEVFRVISQIENPEDGIIFESDSIEAREITVNKEYHGVRLTIIAHLDSIIQPISLDIGFGDIITPEPQVLEYPVLIDGMQAPIVMAYSMETVIAEKFEAMITLASDNSRMKDFFDVYRLLKHHSFSKDTLTEAIQATFNNRGTILEPDHILFQKDFVDNKSRLTAWKAFLKRIKWKEELSFEEVVSTIAAHLKPIYDSIANL